MLMQFLTCVKKFVVLKKQKRYGADLFLLLNCKLDSNNRRITKTQSETERSRNVQDTDCFHRVFLQKRR